MWELVIFIWFVAIALALILRQLKINQKNYLHYKKRFSVMTHAEQAYFKKLQETYDQQYYIFPQINLDKLVEVTTKKSYYHYFNKINRKSVDFVIADKNTLETIKVIELDDWTHGLEKRKERDDFINNVLEVCSIIKIRQK